MGDIAFVVLILLFSASYTLSLILFAEEQSFTLMKAHTISHNYPLSFSLLTDATFESK